MRWWWLLAVLCACDETAPAPEAKPGVSVAVGMGSSATSSVARATRGAPTASPAPIASDAPPLSDRWAEAPTRVLAGAPDGCEARGLGPWIRVACRGATSIAVTRGGGDGRTYAVRTPEGAALVTRFVEGVRVVAEMGWGERSQRLVVRWAQGEARPDAVGRFAEP